MRDQSETTQLNALDKKLETITQLLKKNSNDEFASLTPLQRLKRLMIKDLKAVGAVDELKTWLIDFMDNGRPTMHHVMTSGGFDEVTTLLAVFSKLPHDEKADFFLAKDNTERKIGDYLLESQSTRPRDEYLDLVKHRFSQAF